MSPPEGELAAVCQTIAEDGALTGDEVRYLAEWLTANPAARETSIGSKLVETLNDILADGEINEEELHRLAPLIGEAIAWQFSAAPPAEEYQVAVAQEPSETERGFVAGVKQWLRK